MYAETLSKEEFTILFTKYDTFRSLLASNPENTHYKNKMIAARNKIIEHNIKLVSSIANRYRNVKIMSAKMPTEDAVQYGIFGLMTALEKYNPEDGEFSTYAVHWIRKHINDALLNDPHLVRKPAAIMRKAKKFDKIKTALLVELQREPTDEEVLQKMGINKHFDTRMAYINASRRTTASLNVSQKDDAAEAQSLIADPKAVDPLEEVCYMETKSRIYEGINNLPENEQIIINLRQDGATLKEVGEALNLSKQRVEQLEKRALKKLEQKIA